MRKYILPGVLQFMLIYINAQAKFTVHISDKNSKVALAFVNIFENNQSLSITDSVGNASFNLTDGKHTIIISSVGYTEIQKEIEVPAIQHLEIELILDSTSLDEVIVSSTRNNTSIENNPTKIEVLDSETMDEENGIKPGSIASVLGDVSGVQIQQTSAVSGNANVRIQGLDGKYTQILRDGMPLYDGFSGSLGLLSIPPLDLQQVELIKGSSSTLYGGGAIAGLVNLISKKPSNKQEADILVNYTTLREFNGNAYISKKYKKVGYTFFAGYNNQLAKDVNKDGLSDVSKYQNGVIHPTLFFYIKEKTIFKIGYSGTIENRIGGDILVLKGKADSIHLFFERNQSQRHTGDYSIDHYFAKDIKLTIKGIVSNFYDNATSNTNPAKAIQLSYYNEASVFVPTKNESNLVAGINYVGDKLDIKTPDSSLIKQIKNNTVGFFGQYSWHIKDHTIFESGFRLDVHTKYGVYALPRVSVIHHFNESWGIRAGAGMGYKTPNPFATQLQDISVTKIMPPVGVKSELSLGINAEVNYSHKWSEDYSIFINQAFYFTQVYRPILFVKNSDGTYFLQNQSKSLLTGGSDTYVKCELKGWELYLGYTYNEAHRLYIAANNFVPITPRHRFAFVVSKEWKERYRIGVEGSLIGRQHRLDGSLTPVYFLAAGMVSVKVGKYMLFVVNCENMLNYKQSRNEPLYTGSITNPTFNPLWAPVDGWVLNASIRFKL